MNAMHKGSAGDVYPHFAAFYAVSAADRANYRCVAASRAVPFPQRAGVRRADEYRRFADAVLTATCMKHAPKMKHWSKEVHVAAGEMTRLCLMTMHTIADSVLSPHAGALVAALQRITGTIVSPEGVWDMRKALPDGALLTMKEAVQLHFLAGDVAADYINALADAAYTPKYAQLIADVAAEERGMFGYDAAPGADGGDYRKQCVAFLRTARSHLNLLAADVLAHLILTPEARYGTHPPDATEGKFVLHAPYHVVGAFFNHNDGALLPEHVRHDRLVRSAVALTFRASMLLLFVDCIEDLRHVEGGERWADPARASVVFAQRFREKDAYAHEMVRGSILRSIPGLEMTQPAGAETLFTAFASEYAICCMYETAVFTHEGCMDSRRCSTCPWNRIRRP